MRARDIPLAHTPPGGYGSELPPPILAGCDEPLADGAPDLRGTWKLVSMEPVIDAVLDHVERIEQAGDRICVTTEGLIHDMFADGTVEHGVHDVDGAGRPISVVCTFEDGVHVLRPVGLDVEVTRRLDGDQLVWTYGPMFTARLERVCPGSPMVELG
jgi:hypothetical protein